MDLAELQAEGLAELRENAAVLYRTPLTFTLGAHTWEVRANVRDPDPNDQRAYTRATTTADTLNLAVRDLRFVRFHPDDTVPALGAKAPYDFGLLEVVEVSSADFLGLRVAVCVLRR